MFQPLYHCFHGQLSPPASTDLAISDITTTSLSGSYSVHPRRIGVGSSNRYNARNPFTLAVTESMLRLALPDFSNYEIMPVPDLDDGPRWRAMVKEIFGELDAFVTDNPYVANLMKDDYRLMRPVDWLPPSDHIRIDGTTVRVMMAKGEKWQDWVPERVAQYIEENQLDERFRREFGLETLANQIRTADDRR